MRAPAVPDAPCRHPRPLHAGRFRPPVQRSCAQLVARAGRANPHDRSSRAHKTFDPRSISRIEKQESGRALARWPPRPVGARQAYGSRRGRGVRAVGYRNAEVEPAVAGHLVRHGHGERRYAAGDPDCMVGVAGRRGDAQVLGGHVKVVHADGRRYGACGGGIAPQARGVRALHVGRRIGFRNGDGDGGWPPCTAPPATPNVTLYAPGPCASEDTHTNMPFQALNVAPAEVVRRMRQGVRRVAGGPPSRGTRPSCTPRR